MKVRPSVKPICEKCKIIRRKGKVMVICENGYILDSDIVKALKKYCKVGL